MTELARGEIIDTRARVVTHAWLLDPIERILEVLRLEGPQWMILPVHASDEEVRAEPFEATCLPLARLWVD